MTGAVGRSGSEALRNWLLNAALPLWATRGVDVQRGGFFERLQRDLSPIEEMRRSRLVARQIYCFATGHQLGWDGPSPKLVAHGLDFLLSRLVRPDGTVLMAVSADGGTVNASYDAYDNAFVMFALAAATKAYANGSDLEGVACNVRDRLLQDWSHPVIGFQETSPPSKPLKANPHMHLFEACLAWEELVGARDPQWAALADNMAQLALDHLISKQSGALSEYFDLDWRPCPQLRDTVVEPGHQFEWSWLLGRWAALRGSSTAFAAALRLAEIGERHGVDKVRGVAINALDGELSPRDCKAKPWPQTERIKAWHSLAHHPMNSAAGRAQAAAHVPAAIVGLELFLNSAAPGLWHEQMLEDASFDLQAVRASTLYHVTCAVHTLSQPVAIQPS